MNKYEKDKVIGTGTFGTVWLVKSKLSRFSYVLKEVDLMSLTDDDRKRAFSEVSILSRCCHENIVRYKDCIIDHSIGRLYIIMEYADNGDLHSAIIRQKGVPFPESSVIFWFIQICLALQYIHYRNILHRDLKPKNIFLTKNNSVKVGDFGISRSLGVNSEFAMTSIGTPYYLSPEICNKKPYNHKSDMWALGCTLFELSALEHPFKADNFFQLINKITGGKRRELPCWSSSLIKELVENLLYTDPTIRSSANKILELTSLQPYLSKYLLNHNSRQNASFLVSSRKISPEELKSPEKYSAKKRTASTLNPQPSKRMFLPKKEENFKVDKMLVPSHKSPANRKLSPSAETNKKQYEITYINPSTKGTMLKNSPKSKVILNVTYIVPDKSDNQKPDQSSEESQNHGNILTRAIDCGYQSEETNVCSSGEKINNEQYVPAHSSEKCKECYLPSGSREISSELEDSKSLTRSKLNSTEISFTHCEHGQCHQCILDMLWKNRIRACAEDSVNVKEYNKLKNKLLLVFPGDVFEKVYQSLLHGWGGNEIRSSVSINNYIKNLNYEQVQNLPLMMQLIQLDLHIKPKEN